MRLYLLGFMGSGKSFSGKKLAEKFDMSFIDLDDYIEAKEGCTIREIFEEKGENYIKWMNENGVTVFLETSVEILSDRLFDEMQKRPLLNGLSKEELKHFIQQKLEERDPFYHQTQILYKQNERNQDVAEELRKYFFKMI
jgi:shikimate kinase